MKTVLITGASSGLGKAMALRLHAAGMKVYGTGRHPEKCTGVPFVMLKLDVNNAESIDRAIKHIYAEQTAIDVLINNAGKGIAGPLEETPEAESKAVFETNFFGPIRMIKAVLPGMRQKKSGLIINITSMAGYMGLPYRGMYSATKSALEILGESWSMELRTFGVEMVSVAPGDFATNIAAGRYHVPLQKDSPYAEGYGVSLEMMNQHVDKGGNPDEVAQLVEKIIANGPKKVHYKAAAFMEKTGVVLKRVLPDLWFQKMMMKHFKL